MKKAFTIILLTTLFAGAFAQQKISISGIVVDSGTEEALIGVNVVDNSSKYGCSTDNSGYFSMQIVIPTTVTFSYIGYTTQTVQFNNNVSKNIKIALSPNSQILEEVTINAQRSQSGDVASMSIKEIMEIPAISGKPDIAKSLQLMPGISTQREGTSILNVRGGESGENLYLFDNVPIIYVNHLGGFFSTFNPDIINNINVFKSGFPAKYGGKLSSIVEITQKEGNKKEYKGNLHIGLSDIAATIEGPTALKNSSFIVCARKTFVGAYLMAASAIADQDYIINYGFYDLNGKFSWNPTEKSKLSINFYSGDDYLSMGNKPEGMHDEKYRIKNIWGNTMISAQYQNILGSKTFLNANISYSKYRTLNKTTIKFPNDATPNVKHKFLSSLSSTRSDISIKHNFFNCWNVELGVQAELQTYLPTYNYEEKSKIYLPNLSTYISTNVYFLKYSSIYCGLRANALVSKSYKDYSLEPRAAISIGFSNNHHLKFNYMRGKQYSHLIFTSGNIMNNEVWIPSDNSINPSKVEQYSAGWESSFCNNKFSLSINAYHKKSSDLATYKEGYRNLIGDNYWKAKVETGGKGTAYGIEFLLRKTRGSFTGFISYTYSRAFRTFANINEGKIYPYDFDRPHCFDISASYKINEKLKVSATWTYQTGIPYTPAIGKKYIPIIQDDGTTYNIECLIYGEKNSQRMKDYHRLDIGLIYEFKTKRNRDAAWSFNIYNAYNRKNPYFYYYNINNKPEIYAPDETHNAYELKLYQISFFPIIATVSYKINFTGKRLIKN